MSVPKKKVVYVASPYTKGDPAINTHFQCKVFDELLSDGIVTPIVPLWTHLQHLIFPREYRDWINYDLEIASLCDCCLRLNAEYRPIGYVERESSGADNEVREFKRWNKPVFTTIQELYTWVQNQEVDANA